MSDFSYYVATEPPPAPKVGPWLWLRSWLRPVRGWTEGRGFDPYLGGEALARSSWEVSKGQARKIYIDHVGCKTCSCLDERRFRQ